MFTVLQLLGIESDALYTGIRVWKNSMLKLCEWIGGTKTKIYCQGTICRRRVLAVLRTIKVGLTKVGNQAKPLKYSEKKLYFIPIYSRCTNVWPTMKQQRLTCALKNARLLPDVRCCLGNKGSEILCRINILPKLMTVGLDGEGPWFGLPGHRT